MLWRRKKNLFSYGSNVHRPRPFIKDRRRKFGVPGTKARGHPRGQPRKNRPEEKKLRSAGGRGGFRFGPDGLAPVKHVRLRQEEQEGPQRGSLGKVTCQ